MLSYRFLLSFVLFGFVAVMMVQGKKVVKAEVTAPAEQVVTEVIHSSTPAANETSAIETVEKMAIEAKDFVVESASSLIHKVGELMRQAMQTLQELMKSDDKSVNNSTVVEETPAPKRKPSKKKSKKSFITTTIPEESEEEE